MYTHTRARHFAFAALKLVYYILGGHSVPDNAIGDDTFPLISGRYAPREIDKAPICSPTLLPPWTPWTSAACHTIVRVAQQRSPLAELLAEESKGGETRDSNFLEKEDRIFNWQEKVFGPFEIDFYADEKNCLTDCQREYHRRISDEHLEGARLYSYTENDSYYVDDDLLTTPYRQGLDL